MSESDTEIQNYLNLFLKSRKSEKTREYSNIIINYLKSIRNDKNQGWIQSKDLKEAMVQPDKIPNASSFFNLIEDMVSFKLIERRARKKGWNKRGKTPVFYRMTVYFSPFNAWTKDEIISDYNKMKEIFLEVNTNFRAAVDLLSECLEKKGDLQTVAELIRNRSKQIREDDLKSFDQYMMQMDEPAREFFKEDLESKFF
jgi:hypothetical protein